MAKKLTKSALKEIVKECLVEILQEGFGNTLDEQLSRNRNAVIREGIDSGLRSTRKVEPNTAQGRPGLDNISWGNNKPKESETFNTAVNTAVNQITSDPILSEILSDTARTTLQNQIAGEKMPSAAGGDHATRVVASSDPMSLFGDSSRNWSKLAFND